MAEMAERLVIQLGLEELVYLLRALHAPTLPGLDTSPIDRLDRDHQDLAFAVADRTLRARNYLFSPTAADRIVEPVVAGVLREAAQPRFVLDMRSTARGREGEAVISLGPKRAIARNEVEPGIHRFIVIQGASEATDLILQAIPFGDGRTAGEPTIIPTSLLDSATSVAASNPEQARAALSSALVPDLAAATARVLAAADGRLGIGIAAAGQADQRWLTLAQDATDMLLFETGGATARILPTNAAAARAAIAAFVAPAIGQE